MKTVKKIEVIIFIIVTANAQAQLNDSLVQYLEIAARNNPLVMERYYEYQAALQKIPQVGSLPDPELSLGVFIQPMELIGGNQVADIKLMQMFPWFGVLKNGRDEMSLMAKAKFESFRDAKLQVFYDVRRTWYEIYKLNEDIRISEKNVEILKTIERLALVKYRSGETGAAVSSSGTPGTSAPAVSAGTSGMQIMNSNNTTSSSPSPQAMQGTQMNSASPGSGLSDLYRIQIEIGELNNNIALLENQIKTAKAKFNTYLNRPVKSDIILPDTIVSDTLRISLIAAFDSMLVNNPMLGMIQYEQQSLESRSRMVSRMGYPMVGLGVNYMLINKSTMSSSQMNGEDMIMPMVTVTMPVYRKKYKAMRTEVELKKTATEQNYKATANSLQVEYYEALQLFQDSERRLRLYTDQKMLAKKSLDIMIKSFSGSGSGLTEILRIRQQTLDYELKLVEALADYNIAVAWIDRLTAFINIQ